MSRGNCRISLSSSVWGLYFQNLKGPEADSVKDKEITNSKKTESRFMEEIQIVSKIETEL